MTFLVLHTEVNIHRKLLLSSLSVGLFGMFTGLCYNCPLIKLFLHGFIFMISSPLVSERNLLFLNVRLKTVLGIEWFLWFLYILSKLPIKFP